MEDFHKKGGFKKPRFGNNPSFGGRKSFGGKGGFRSNEREQVTLHQATCNECGKDCQVPFRPSGDRPVYCRDCFAKNAPPRPLAEGKRNFTPPVHDSRPSHAMVPVRDRGQDSEIAKQLQGINAKLERLIELMEKQALGRDVKDALKTIEGVLPKSKVRKSAKK